MDSIPTEEKNNPVVSDGGATRARLLIIAEDTVVRLREIPGELIAAIEEDNKKRALALVEELAKATRLVENP